MLMKMKEATDESTHTGELEANLTDSCLVSLQCMCVHRGKISNRKNEILRAVPTSHK